MSPTDLKRVTELLTAPASEGDIVAECLLSLVRKDGKVVSGVPKHPPPTQDAARRSLDKDIQRAAAAVLRAEDNLSLVREDGAIGVPRPTPPAQVIERLSAEAAQGDAQAQCLLGIMHADGNGVPRNLRRASELWSASAAQGDDNAQFNLGAMCMVGNGGDMSKDPKRAVELWTAAAARGNAHAQLNLGQVFADGDDGVPKDLKRATELWTAAAAQGRPFASAKAEAALRRLHKGADQAAVALLEAEDREKNAATARSARKAAKRREAKKKKQYGLMPLHSIHERGGEVVEEPVLPGGGGDCERCDFECVDLSDLGLLKRDNDAATSVATALTCVVCMSNERAVACVPCGHMCLCEGCGTTGGVGDKCPMCRTAVSMFMRVFG